MAVAEQNNVPIDPQGRDAMTDAARPLVEGAGQRPGSESGLAPGRDEQQKNQQRSRRGRGVARAIGTIIARIADFLRRLFTAGGPAENEGQRRTATGARPGLVKLLYRTLRSAVARSPQRRQARRERAAQRARNRLGRAERRLERARARHAKSQEQSERRKQGQGASDRDSQKQNERATRRSERGRSRTRNRVHAAQGRKDRAQVRLDRAERRADSGGRRANGVERRQERLERRVERAQLDVGRAERRAERVQGKQASANTRMKQAGERNRVSAGRAARRSEQSLQRAERADRRAQKSVERAQNRIERAQRRLGKAEVKAGMSPSGALGQGNSLGPGIQVCPLRERAGRRPTKPVRAVPSAHGSTGSPSAAPHPRRGCPCSVTGRANEAGKAMIRTRGEVWTTGRGTPTRIPIRRPASSERRIEHGRNEEGFSAASAFGPRPPGQQSPRPQRQYCAPQVRGAGSCRR